MFFQEICVHTTDGETNSIPRLLFCSNWAAVIRNQILIRTLIGAFIFNKMNAFLKLTSRFKFRIINSLMLMAGGGGGGGGGGYA